MAVLLFTAKFIDIYVNVTIMLMLFYQRTSEETLKELRSSEKGLSKHEASKRLKEYGLNEIIIKGDPLWRKIVEPFASVFMLVLFVAAGISLLHDAIFDAVIIIAIMMASAVIYYVQRFSTEKILRSLQKKSDQQAEVIRGGSLISIPTPKLVPGDIINVSEGDKVPADIRIIKEAGVQADESMLTGESIPIEKTSDALNGKYEIYEQKNTLFQGSFIVSGSALGVVTATGNDTEFGKIAALANNNGETASSPVQRKIDKLISYCIAAVSAIAVVAFILAVYRGVEVSEALQFVIALSVSAVPESLPIAISVVLVLGMRRMAAKKALVRSMGAIETIGVITTIATDKTGTLTKNELSVQETWQPSWAEGSILTALEGSIVKNGETTKDPLDSAFVKYKKTDAKKNQPKGLLSIQLPFDQKLAMSGNIWKSRGAHTLYVKGAPEHLMMKSKLTRAQMSEVTKAVTQLTSQGYRVIALATSPLTKPFEEFTDYPKSLKLDFAGLIAIADTLRPSARAAIASAQRAGVSVRMITGDHLETAYSIGKKLGLVNSKDEVFDSRLMIDMDDKQLAKAADKARVFSRVTPENKYRILQVLKLKEVTAMTGDGVNDVPALANAHVGVSMGSGSQIAKDAGDIILLNDDFASIVRAMREGRIIFSNIRRMLFYLLSTNIGEVIVMLGALIVGMPIPLAPVQILWINLVTDTSMVIPIGLEPGEKNIMKQRPIKPTAPILNRYMISRILLVAFMMGALALGLFAYFRETHGDDYARTIVFSALVVIQWANAFNARSTYEPAFSRIRVWHAPFWIGLAIAMSMQLLALFGPLQQALSVTPVALSDLAIVSVGSFALTIILVDIHKFFGRRRKLRQDT